MKKNYVVFLCGLSLFFLFCIGGIAQTSSWTFLVYLDGDCNLEDAAIDDFLEMAAVGSTADVNIVVQMDRIDGYDDRYGDWTGTKRFLITQGMTPVAASAVLDLGELNMGDPATLDNFIQWGKATYPASRYAVVLWNHGGGWRQSKYEKWLARKNSDSQKKPLEFKAVCWDDTSGGDCLYMDEVEGAFTSAGSVNLIGFDACLMGMTEVAYEIKNFGEVMVGSEETEPWDGWPFETIMADLVANPAWTAAQLGTDIVNRYYESYGNDQTLSAIDLGQMDTVAASVSSLAQSIMDNWDSDEAAVKSAAGAVMAALDSAVIHEMHGDTWPGASGLAIYLQPSSGLPNSDYNGTVINFPADTLWEEFLSDFNASMQDSWISLARDLSQSFYEPEHVDLYHFCENLQRDNIDFYTETLVPSVTNGGGVAQGFQADDGFTTYTLPFDFRYFDQVVASGSDIYISSNGYVDFDNSSDHSDFSDTLSELAANRRIAPCWTDLKTDGTAQSGEDVYIEENIPEGYVMIRWVAETYGDGTPINVEMVLYQNGNIQFNYGSGNNPISTYGPGATIGISKGDGNIHLSSHYHVNNLANAETVVFKLIFGEIQITAPNGGEAWGTGEVQNITWTGEDLAGGLVRIQLYQNGVKLGNIARNVDASLGTYPWTVGTYIGGTAPAGAGFTIQIRVQGTTVRDESDAPFAITGGTPEITILSPNGGESWGAGTSRDITWSSQGMTGSLVRIMLYRNGAKVGNIASNLDASAGTYSWTVGSFVGGTAPTGSGYTIRIREQGTTVNDYSDASFSITSATPEITVLSPNGGESWGAGTSHNITWSSQNLAPGALLRLQLYRNGAKVGNIASNVDATLGAYSWAAGNYIGGTAPAGGGYTIRIRVQGTTLKDASNASFTIQ